jgi:hypothetical protein
MTINTTRTTRELADGNEMPMLGFAAGLKPQTELVSAELTDEQLATLRSYGTTEQTLVGQVLATAGDPSYDLMIVLEGEVECSDIDDGRHRALLVYGPRDSSPSSTSSPASGCTPRSSLPRRVGSSGCPAAR